MKVSTNCVNAQEKLTEKRHTAENNYRLTEATKARKTNKDTKKQLIWEKRQEEKVTKKQPAKELKGQSEPPGRQSNNQQPTSDVSQTTTPRCNFANHISSLAC